jgi:2-methylcitrate dehydratase PrpD|tara:strand:+ start:5863 stop:7221 length:1359 start_codon:yes stop_codon:yes gene_type:complete
MLMPVLAKFIVDEYPSDAAVSVAVPAVADGFGCILAGASSEVAMRLAESLPGQGAGWSSLFGTGKSITPSYAALINAAAGHAYDLDDWEEPGNTHPTIVILPALLAAASVAADRGVICSGSDLLAAYCVGTEIIMRTGEAITLSHYERGFHATATLGAIGAAAASARLLGLDETAVSHALGLAASQATGYTLQFGTNAKPLQAGWAARTGLEAACMAAAGITSNPDTLTSARGFAGLMGVHDEDRLAMMTTRLGRPWALDEYGLVLKPWPSCAYTHRAMTAAAALHPAIAGSIRQISQIKVTMVDFHYAILPFHDPRNRTEALFSLPACVAQMLVTGQMTLADGENNFWDHGDVAFLISRTEVAANSPQRPEYNYDPEQPDILQVRLQDGTILQEAVPYPLGAAQNPMSQTQLAEKFSGCTKLPISAFDALLEWHECRDVMEFFANVGGRDS